MDMYTPFSLLDILNIWFAFSNNSEYMAKIMTCIVFSEFYDDTYIDCIDILSQAYTWQNKKKGKNPF
jgi:hypothetical protein